MLCKPIPWGRHSLTYVAEIFLRAGIVRPSLGDEEIFSGFCTRP